MLPTLDSETPRWAGVHRGASKRPVKEDALVGVYPIGTTATTPLGTLAGRDEAHYPRQRPPVGPTTCERHDTDGRRDGLGSRSLDVSRPASALMGTSSEGRMPGAAEDMRPGRLPKVRVRADGRWPGGFLLV